MLNYGGYAKSKLDRAEVGVGCYPKPVPLDTRYVQMREYLGEAYVAWRSRAGTAS